MPREGKEEVVVALGDEEILESLPTEVMFARSGSPLGHSFSC